MGRMAGMSAGNHRGNGGGSARGIDDRRRPCYNDLNR